MSIGTDVLAAGYTAWRDWITDGVASSGENEAKKAEIRAFVAALGAGLDQITASLASIGEGVVSGDARIVSTLAILDAGLSYPAGTIGVVYADSTAANNGYYLKAGASGAGSWSKIAAMTLPVEIIDRVTALETDLASLGALAYKSVAALTDIEQIPDQTILGRTGPGTGSGPVNAMTPTQARNLIDAPSKADLEDVSWYSFSVGDSTSCIFIGDSLTAGFGAMMNKGPIQKISAYTNIVCHNYGRPSYTTEGLLTSLRAQTPVFLGNIQTLRPTYGMILTGANDEGTFAEREGWLRQLGETAAGQGLEVSFTRSHYWIGGEQASILYSVLAERFGGDFVDVRRAYNLFCLTGKTEGFWRGSHPGTRTNEIFAGPLTEWIRGKACQQSIKLFRARDDSAAIADLAYHPADFYARDQRWREICVGERSIAPEDIAIYDAIQDGFNIVDRNSEYASLVDGNSLNMGRHALVVITMPANAANLESVQIDIGADVDACYYYNPIVSPYSAAGETVGNWSSVTLRDRTFTFNETYLSRAVWGDQIVLLLTAAAGVQLSAPIVRWKGRPGKPAVKAKPALAGGEYLAATDAGADVWVLSPGAVQRAPSDGSLPVGCTQVIALDAGESASQPIELPAESAAARELELTVWVRRPPTVSVGIATHDTARVSVGLSSGALAATVDVVAGLWWRECKVRLTVPPGLAAPSLVITTDRPVEIARGGVALVGAGSATGAGDPSEAAEAAQSAADQSAGARDQAQLAAAAATSAAEALVGAIPYRTLPDFVSADIPVAVSEVSVGVGDTRRHLLRLDSSPPVIRGWHTLSHGSYWRPSERDVTPYQFGAKVDGLTDDAAALNDCIEFSAETGARILQPPGLMRVGSPILWRAGASWHGFDRRRCIVQKLPGHTGRMLQTINFDALVGTTDPDNPLLPSGIDIQNLTFDGAFMTPDKTAYINETGDGLMVFVTDDLILDVIVQNMAGIGAWIDGISGGDGNIGWTNYTRLKLWVETTKAEGVIFKGLGDQTGHIIYQLDAGARLPSEWDAGADPRPSTLYGTVNTDGVHLHKGTEKTFVHAFGNRSGQGIIVHGGRHNDGYFMSESNRYGGIEVLGGYGQRTAFQAHRSGGYDGDTRPMILFNAPTDDSVGYTGTTLAAYHKNSWSTTPRDCIQIGPAARGLQGFAMTRGDNVPGHGVVIDGAANFIDLEVDCWGHTGVADDGLNASAIYRKATFTSRMMSIIGRIQNSAVGLRSSGTPRNEKIDLQMRLVTGQTPVVGDLRAYPGQKWSINAVINDTDYIGSEDSTSFNFDSSLSTTQAFTWTPRLVAIADTNSISYSVWDSSTGAIATGGVAISFSHNTTTNLITFTLKMISPWATDTAPVLKVRAKV